jgi:hemin uptake protein HemP
VELEASNNRSRESTRQAEPASSGSIIYRSSDEIFKGLREIVIHHNGAEYRLRITASDKLILTK